MKNQFQPQASSVRSEGVSISDSGRMMTSVDIGPAKVITGEARSIVVQQDRGHATIVVLRMYKKYLNAQVDRKRDR